VGHRAALWRAFADALPGMRAEFVAITSGGALIGGGGVVIERRAGLHWIHALPWLLPGAPWAAPGAAAEVDRAFAGALAARVCELRAAGGTWAAYRPDDPVDRAALEAVGGETRRFEAALIELGEGVETAWRRIERRGRQDLERSGDVDRADKDRDGDDTDRDPDRATQERVSTDPHLRDQSGRWRAASFRERRTRRRWSV